MNTGGRRPVIDLVRETKVTNRNGVLNAEKLLIRINREYDLFNKCT